MLEHVLSRYKLIAFLEHLHNPITKTLFGFNVNRKTTENIKKAGLKINKEIAINLSKQKLDKQISRLYRPKWTAVLIGVPYTILLIVITIIASVANAYLVAIGFGAISLIMAILLGNYFYQIYLISEIRNSDEILSTQQQLSKLRISSFNSLNLEI